MGDVRQQIAANAEIVIDDLAPLAERVKFGLNPESVQWLDGFIERYRAGADFDADACGGLVNMLGCFLGECIVANAEGTWEHFDDQAEWGVRLPSNSAAFPFTKVAKQLRNGAAAGDSISSFYRVAVEFVATGGLDD